MPDYELTPGAESDLLDIALYTLENHGLRQTDIYEAALERNFKGINSGETRTRVVFDHWPELRVSRCEHHYVFALLRDQDCPLIVGVFHEKMDLMTRLRERLDLEGEG